MKKAKAWVTNRSNPSHHSLRRSRAAAVLLHDSLGRELAGDVARFDGVAFHDDSAVTKQVVIYHVRSHHGDDDLVVANDAAPSLDSMSDFQI